MVNSRPRKVRTKVIPIPKTWPNDGEGLEAYRERIYALHQERIINSQQPNTGNQLLGFEAWLSAFESEVDANWKLNSGKRQLRQSLKKPQSGATSPSIPVLSSLRGPRTTKRLIEHFWVSVLTVGFFIGLGLIGNATSKTADDGRQTSNEVLMPNIVGMTYGDFVENNSKLIETYFPDTIDLIASRSIWDQYNWKVVSQIPPAGTRLKPEDRLCLGVVKLDEVNSTRQRLRCWQEITGFEDIQGFDYDLQSKDLMSLSLRSSDLTGYFLKARVWIEMKDWNSVMLTYCSYEPVGLGESSTINLKLNTGASGSIFGDGGESFDVGLFNDWYGEYTYRIETIEKSFGSGCFSF